ncbi:FtsK/SpoIIIE domain-containing protein [Pseudarthrobacter sp. N5]|uniref:FtsK/SpoIIIE domain-containing protein n=1 Tax=Pseudarthrobacter sp. N5 TaxID=3418416 RepID=UPI003CF27EF5
MPLHCTLVRRPGAGRTDAPVELTIEAVPGSSGDELQAALARGFGTQEVTVNGVSLTGLTVGAPPLVNGAVLVDGPGRRMPRPLVSRDAGPPASLVLAVHSGPGAGTLLPLRRGTYRIGRSTTEVIIPDADISREHARLEVSDTAITIVDLDSANGTEVDGKRVRNAVVSTGSVIRCGSSTMSVVFGGPTLSGADLAKAGRSVAEPLSINRRPEAGNRTTLILTAGLPLVIGVGLAVMTGMWMFLAFTAVSAVSVLVPVISGRRQRREQKSSVAAAVKEDRERRRRCAPSAADLILADPPSGAEHDAAGTAPEGVWLRLGQAEQPAHIKFEPADPEAEVPSLVSAPLTLDPSIAMVVVRGPLAASNGLARSLIIQLLGYPSARATRVLIHGRSALLPLAARYHHSVILSADLHTSAATVAAGPGPGYARGVLMILGDAASAASDTELQESARNLGWQVLHFSQSAGAAPDCELEMGERSATYRRGSSTTAFVPDLVPEEVFNRYCRRLASTTDVGVQSVAHIPETCSLSDVMPLSTEETSSRWDAGRLRPGLPVPIGLTAAGLRVLDLEADGPHLLVAGTTGSGKSELLRSLTAALALSYSPARINFLFVDFKGGSGLGPLTGLPHCVGMLTDLKKHELDRALASLRAEIRLREELLAAVQAPDLAAYRQTDAAKDSPLPQLILIIDEFRMLVEDAPEALGELMRIATIGRSLGIHLIMATQRPQGALTADIRANVTTSIALRVQTAMDSADIINVSHAADISVGTPGRAFLARGTEEAEEFQTASLARSSPELPAPGIQVRRADDALRWPAAVPSGHGTHQLTVTPAVAAAPIVESTRKLWASIGGTAVRRPVAMPLPAPLPYPDQHDSPESGPGGAAGDPRALADDDGAGREERNVQLGWQDLPEQQRIALLEWNPANQGHLALVGGPAGGVPDAMSLALHQLMTDRIESHFYILDADSSFTDMASSERVGAVAGLHEMRLGVRVLERVAREMSARLSRPRGVQETPLVLVVSGWGSWVSAFRAGPLMWAEDVLQDIVRDGSAAGISVIISGERELVTSRLFASVPNRIFFPAGTSEDSRLSWPRLPETAPLPGRAVAFGSVAGGRTTVCQFFSMSSYLAVGGVPGGSDTGKPSRAASLSLAKRPFRVEPLPVKVHVRDVLSRLPGAGNGSLQPRSDEQESSSTPHRRLYVGLGGDELDPASVRLPSGSVLAVLGGPSSGKSSLIAALPSLNPAITAWICPGLGTCPSPGAEEFWAEIHARAVSGRLDRQAVALVDDADLLPAAANQHLVELHNLGWTVILTAGFSSTLMQRVPLALSARSYGTGLLIAPRSLRDGDFFGQRFEPEASPPPGRAVLISEGRATAVQLSILAPSPPPVRGTGHNPATEQAGSLLRARQSG